MILGQITYCEYCRKPGEEVCSTCAEILEEWQADQSPEKIFPKNFFNNEILDHERDLNVWYFNWSNDYGIDEFRINARPNYDDFWSNIPKKKLMKAEKYKHGN